MASMPLHSPNFSFLEKYNKILVRHAALAERYLFDDSNSALIKLRQFGELLAEHCAAYTAIPVNERENFNDVINKLWNANVIDEQVSQLFHGLRKAGNIAAHSHVGQQRDALHQLQMARQLAVWFHRSFGGDRNFKAGPFVVPPDPAQAEQELIEELNRLREAEITAKTEADQLQVTLDTEIRLKEEIKAGADKAFADLTAAMELATESEQELEKARKQYEQQLAELQRTIAQTPVEQQQKTITTAHQLGSEINLDEAATRKIIDQQLRDAGWEVDTATMRYSKGVRPAKGRNMAIAEWPTANGPADYCLFLGLIPIAVVEAKRKHKDVAGSIQQSKRYSKGFEISSDQISPGGPWGEYQIPFLFATNGRPFLRQLAEKSGNWFLDARREVNHPRPLEDWYTPLGLEQLLKQEIAEADQRLEEESLDYLPLRDYQRKAIRTVEKAIAKGRQEMLVAMATGTGKTRTCIGLIYRLIKSGRFRRVLFLVDRSALGTQSADSFKDVRIENLQSFADIYDVKELGDLRPEKETKVHIATVQGMVKRILY
ncbi:MAG: DEAD/DEAH box helicase family protein, partial [Planctomycetaceae bacterium]|nr:DEAD/DEAH box helicase family protein [Planctomycetaceae bacterium]